MSDLCVLQRVFCMVLTVLVIGCSEGGTGGTGGITPPDTTTVSMSGYDHKGPFQAGSTVRVTQLSQTGESELVLGTTEIVSNLGDYHITLEASGPLKIDVSGSYFSETAGEYAAGGIELTAIMDPVDGNNLVNVNLLTHLIHSRVLHLISDGSIDVAQAIEMAQSELLLAFSDLLPPPDGPVEFSSLLVINSIQEGDDETGNAYLLALSSVLEQNAANLAIINNTDLLVEFGSFIDQLEADLGNDGVLDLSLEVKADLRQSMSEIIPSDVYLNLLKIDELRDLAIQASDLTAQATPPEFGETVIWVNDSFEFSADVDGDVPLTARTRAADIMADMDLFIDSDGDGVVNSDDEDDDGDGSVDEGDVTPYGDGQ